MLELTEHELENVCRLSDTLTLREQIYRAESTGGEYVYTYTELWSDGQHVVRVSIRRAKYPEYSFAGTFAADLRDLPHTWRESGVTLPAVEWHEELVTHSQYSAPTKAMTMAATLVYKTLNHLGL